MWRRETAAAGAALRVELREKYADIDRRLGRGRYRPLIKRLDDGDPVVMRGWEITSRRAGVRLDPNGDYCLEPDGRITTVEPVCADPDKRPNTVIDYRRPDGSLVLAESS
jgi:hypothetical protein